MTRLRWKLSVAAWWLWLKVTPNHPFKRDIVAGVADLGKRWRAHLAGEPTQ